VRVLILGGTSEARALAAVLHERGDHQVTSSLAGRVSRPVLPPGEVRIGGFGGVAGLVRYLTDQRVHAVVDATHPFAVTISANAAQAAAATGGRLLAVRRPGFRHQPGDHWIRVPDIVAAARQVAALPPGCVFLTTGRRDLAAFAADDRHSYLVRTVEQPAGPLPPRHTLLLARGPYTLDGEATLMHRYAVIALVSKDSGGDMTSAKLAAARARGTPVVMVDRPPLPDGVPTVTTAQEAVSWLDEVVSR
jgi:precorrin-6A/cobalt-precorrin-6A reductase